MPTPQDHRMRAILARLELVSHGTITAYNTSGGHTAERGPFPPGEAFPPHDYWRLRYEQQTSDLRREQTIRDAQDDLERLTGRYQRPTSPQETPGEQVARMLTETEGWAPEDVERSRWRLPARLVRRHRTIDGRDPETGRPTTLHPGQTDEDPAQRARELRGKGMTTRQIAMLLGKHQTQIVRYLRSAA